MHRLLALSFCLFVALIAQSQTKQISGLLLDKSQNPIPGATIKVVGSDNGTVSGPKGYFELEIEATSELEISSVGYQTIRVNSDADLNIEMAESINQLPELMLEANTMTSGKQGIAEIPGSVSYISGVELAERKYTNINDILRQVPGVNVQEEDGFGLRPNIGLRGSGLERSSKITIMEDGVLAAPAPYAAPSAYYFPTVGRMDGVEVMKGSSQIRFGPFTTGGAINFISTPIPAERSGLAEMTVGSFGLNSLHTHFGDQVENFGFVLEAFRYGANGFKTVENGETGFLKNDLNAKFSVNSDPSKSFYQKLTFNVGWTNEDSDETYLGLTEGDFEIDPNQRYAASQLDNMAAEQTRMSFQHYMEIPKLFNVVTKVYRNDFQRNWYKLQSVSGVSLANALNDPSTNQTAYDLLTGNVNTNQGDLVIRANNRVYYSQGVQTVVDFEFETGAIRHDLQISTRFHEDQEDRFQHQDGYGITDRAMHLVNKGAPGSHANRIEHASATSSYLFYTIDFGKLSLNPGLRHEYVEISREDFGKNDPFREINDDYSTRSNLFSAWLPGIGINYSLSQNTQIFGGAHKGFAPGSSKEGSSPESSINYEIGGRTKSVNFSGSVVLFMNDYQNLLGADNASAGGEGTGELFNAGQATTKGMELEFSYQLAANRKDISIPVTLAYTYTDARFDNTFESEFDGWGNVTSGDEIPYLARNQFYFGVDYRTKKFGVNLSGKYQSDIRTTPGSGDIVSSDLIAAFFTADLSFNYYLNGQTSLFTSVSNLANEKYAVSRRPAGLRPGMPRTFRIGASVRL